MDFLNRHWVAILAIVGGITASWAQWEYVSKQVNPETVLAFRVDEARRLQREEIRFCVLAEVSSPEPKMRNIFRCLE